jgi:excisionase family DNA binding protein
MTPAVTLPRALTTAQVADVLQVSPRQVQRMIAAGRLAKVPHMGALVRVAAAELERFMNERSS